MSEINWRYTKRVCTQCKTEYSPSIETQRFCGKKCSGQSRKIPDRVCPVCGGVVAGRDGRIFCSRACGSASLRASPSRNELPGDRKTCTKCNEVKYFSEFSPHKLGIGGVRTICKPCSSAYVLADRKTRPKAVDVMRKARRKRNSTPEGRKYRAEKQREYNSRDPEKFLLRLARRRSAEKGLPCSITEDDIVIPDVCPVLGIQLFRAKTGFRYPKFGGKDNSPSLDKIVPELGYVPGNVAVISWRANSIKTNATLEELEKLVVWLRSVSSPTK